MLTHCLTLLFMVAGPLEARLIQCFAVSRRVKTGQQLGGASHVALLDVSKMFNNISYATIGGLLVKHGCPQPFVDMTVHHFDKVRLRTRFPHRVAGQPWAPPQGLYQGDPLTVLGANLCMSTIVKEVKRRLCLALPHAEIALHVFIDDFTVICDSSHDLQTACGIIHDVLTFFGLSLSVDKSQYISDCPRAKVVIIGGQHVMVERRVDHSWS